MTPGLDQLQQTSEDLTLTNEEKDDLRSSLLSYIDNHPEGSVRPDSLDPIAYGGPSLWSIVASKWTMMAAILAVFLLIIMLAMMHR